MTTTLVLGVAGVSRVRYAESLLQVAPCTVIDAGEVRGRLASAVLSSRRPVLIIGLEEWVSEAPTLPAATLPVVALSAVAD